MTDVVIIRPARQDDLAALPIIDAELLAWIKRACACAG